RTGISGDERKTFGLVRRRIAPMVAPRNLGLSDGCFGRLLARRFGAASSWRIAAHCFRFAYEIVADLLTLRSQYFDRSNVALDSQMMIDACRLVHLRAVQGSPRTSAADQYDKDGSNG